MKPISTSWNVGNDKHGRRVVLTLEDGYFSLKSEPVAQRDEGWRINDLTRENLFFIGEVAKEVKP